MRRTVGLKHSELLFKARLLLHAAEVPMDWQHFVMYGVGLLLIYAGIAKKCEPAILIPLGFGTILVNLPQSSCADGIIHWLFQIGIEASEAMPIILFIGIGAMIDFSPLIRNPVLFFCGIFSQVGIFAGIGIARLLGFALKDAVSIGIIGAADGPTAILVSRTLNSMYAGQISLAAYSYIALVPIFQPLVAKVLTTKNERKIRCDTALKPVSRFGLILFPVAVTFVSGLISPQSAQLVGFIMFGNLLRECGVLNSLAETARTTLVNLITILLGLTISFTLQAESFVRRDTLIILAVGLAAFIIDSAGGILFVKLLNLFRRQKLNPLVGMAGLSAFPIASHVSQRMAQEADSSNVILMQAAGANVAGQICSAVIGGLLLGVMC